MKETTALLNLFFSMDQTVYESSGSKVIGVLPV